MGENYTQRLETARAELGQLNSWFPATLAACDSKIRRLRAVESEISLCKFKLGNMPEAEETPRIILTAHWDLEGRRAQPYRSHAEDGDHNRGWTPIGLGYGSASHNSD